ncbi:MAG TPA: hypothetical protein DCX89_02460 [Saprospirales bacterium]|nr:hypothetical protein [Saprospirales bacterium]HAY70731.1 hypothetical protein [Saprospirales bacterium]
MNIFRFSTTIIAMILCSFLATDSFGQGVINIYEEPEITTLMNKYKTWNELEEMVPAWRIQIINTDDRRKMESEMRRFKSIYSNIKQVNWKQVSPYYKVTVGSFESKLHGLAFLDEVKIHFPSAILINEKISKKELLGLE